MMAYLNRAEVLVANSDHRSDSHELIRFRLPRFEELAVWSQLASSLSALSQQILTEHLKSSAADIIPDVESAQSWMG